jgi:hypothetical protein
MLERGLRRIKLIDLFIAVLLVRLSSSSQVRWLSAVGVCQHSAMAPLKEITTEVTDKGGATSGMKLDLGRKRVVRALL